MKFLAIVPVVEPPDPDDILEADNPPQKIFTVTIEAATIPELQKGVTNLQRAVAAQGWKLD